MVELMEISLKKDVQREVQESKGKILLHDEIEEPAGVYTICPQMETASVEDIMTPRELFEMVAKEGYRVGCLKP